jgi:hypothetical protein
LDSIQIPQAVIGSGSEWKAGFVMALFSKKSKTQTLGAELTGLQQRADALEMKRQVAEAELTASTEARQRQHIEGDLDDAAAAQLLQERVNVAASHVVGLEDAIALVRARLGGVEQAIEAQRTYEERVAAADKLAREVDVIEEALLEYVTAAWHFAESVESISYDHFESVQIAAFLRNTQAQVEIASALAVQELRGMIMQMKTGAGPIPSLKQNAEPAAAAESAASETVFMLRSANYSDHHGRKRFGGQWDDATMPPATAQRAFLLGIAVPVTDPRRAQLRGSRGGDFNPLAHDVINLDQVDPLSTPSVASDAVASANFVVVDRSNEAREIQILVDRV